MLRIQTTGRVPDGGKGAKISQFTASKVPQNTDDKIYFLRVPMTESGAYLGMTLGSWSMLNSSVASRPA